MAAVSLYGAGGAGGFPAPQTYASVVTQILGVQGAKPPYLEPYANVVQTTTKSLKKATKCPGYYITAECENGHRFAKKLVCGKEFCPTCGAKWSDAHKRRFSRWLPKGEQMKEMGYFVFTLPLEIRDQYRTKDALNELTKKITAGDKSRHLTGMLAELGFSRGLARWHWFGDKGYAFNPHLNVLVDAGHISQEKLGVIKRKFASILGVPQAVVNYSYTHKQRKMVHILKYVTRATFHDENWDQEMSGELFNFRNMRAWGEWDGEPAWELKGEQKYAHIDDLEHGICPDCGKPLHWNKALPICLLELEQPQDIGAGYYRLPGLLDKPPPSENQS